MSASLPFGAPASTHFTIVSISRSLRLLSLRNFNDCSESANQGGISRAATRRLIAFAHGLASSYVSSDIGAISPGRWHETQDRNRIGATFFVNVGASAAAARPGLM